MLSDKVSLLVNMGFTASEAETALQANEDDVNLAAEQLLSSSRRTAAATATDTTAAEVLPIAVPVVASVTSVAPPQRYAQTNQTIHHEEVQYISFTQDRRGCCSWLLNLLWIVLGGWHMFSTWFVAGLALCLTCIGIPCGLQVIKISWFLLCPFGKQLKYHHHDISDEGGRCCFRGCNCLLNIVWAVTAGWLLALQALLTGVVFCITIIGIPFGWQCFKLTYLCFCPFGIDFTAEDTEVIPIVNTHTTHYQRMSA